MLKGLTVAAAAMLLATSVNFAHAQAARDTIKVVGSSTVYPFSTVVAETFGKGGKFKTPTIESTGTGGGMKLFCAGVGVGHPDITNASRRMKKSECEDCVKNGVKDIVEVKIGYDGIVIANSKKAPLMKMSIKDLYRAMAKEVEVDGKMVANPYKTWKDVNPELPATKIEVLGPPPTSGTRDAFIELVMEVGAKSSPFLSALSKEDAKQWKAYVHTIREDGAYIDAGENDNLIVQKLDANVNALGIFGFSFLDQNAEKIQGSEVDGVAPTFDNIASGKYTVSRPLYFYVKKAHASVIPGIPEYLAEFTSEKAWGKDGYLADKGMIPMPDAERKEFAAKAKNMTPIDCDSLK
ncbi:MAG: PstS family phosphate ABC transporter substrate-binding protein [Desulfovibrio sp.]|nr:PstS family phosphate ABC transporter substrate-binding protein [Desulfovibrio sp.]